MGPGCVWIVDAWGCDPERLRSRAALAAVFDVCIGELRLTPVAPATWHVFPAPGGVTGYCLLRESHLAVHTFPELGFAAFDLYCCRALAEWDWAARLRALLGAERVTCRAVARGDDAPASRHP